MSRPLSYYFEDNGDDDEEKRNANPGMDDDEGDSSSSFATPTPVMRPRAKTKQQLTRTAATAAAAISSISSLSSPSLSLASFSSWEEAVLAWRRRIPKKDVEGLRAFDLAIPDHMYCEVHDELTPGLIPFASGKRGRENASHRGLEDLRAAQCQLCFSTEMNQRYGLNYTCRDSELRTVATEYLQELTVEGEQQLNAPQRKHLQEMVVARARYDITHEYYKQKERRPDYNRMHASSCEGPWDQFRTFHEYRRVCWKANQELAVPFAGRADKQLPTAIRKAFELFRYDAMSRYALPSSNTSSTGKMNNTSRVMQMWCSEHQRMGTSLFFLMARKGDLSQYMSCGLCIDERKAPQQHQRRQIENTMPAVRGSGLGDDVFASSATTIPSFSLGISSSSRRNR
jgi:hypothetical protein